MIKHNYTKQKIDTVIRWTCYDSEGRVHSTGAPKNLITQYGRNAMASRSIADCFTRLCIGTGTQPLKKEGINISQSGTTVSSLAAFFTSDDATNKRAIVFADGTGARIVSFTSTTQVTVDRSQTVTGQNAIVYFDEIKKLNVFTENTATYVSGQCGVAATNNPDYSTTVHRRYRTFRTTTYPSGVVITELGTTFNAGSDPDMVTLSNLDSSITVPSGGYVDIYYEFVFYFDTSVRTVTAPITGISSDVTECLYGNTVFASMLGNAGGSQVITTSGIDSNGNSQPTPNTSGYYGWFLEPMQASGNALKIYVSEKTGALKSATPIAADNDDTASKISTGITVTPYSTDSFEAIVTGTLIGFNSSSWYSYGMSNSEIATGAGIMKRCEFDDVQTFGAGSSLVLTFTKNWDV